MLFTDAGVGKFQVGKDSDNSFFIYDIARGRTFFNETINGDISLQRVAGNVGIGINSPLFRLHLLSPNQANSTSLGLDTPQSGQQSTIGFLSGGNYKWQLGKQSDESFLLYDAVRGHNDLVVWSNGTGMSLMMNGGAVGIGASPCTNSFAPPGCLLSVAGAIQAKEIVVNTGWADYVFQSNYHLSPLAEVAAYIKDNHHLPGIPSEAEIQEKGVNWGDMEAKLLAKIEELTTHLIQIEQKNQELNEKVIKLGKNSLANGH